MMHKVGRCSAPFARKSGKKIVYYYYVYDEAGKKLKRSTGEHSRTAAMAVIQERIRTGTLITDRMKNPSSGSSMLFRDLAKDVFIPGCESSWDETKRAALYVAITRCSERLYLGFSGRLNSLFPSISDSNSPYYSSRTLNMI